VEKVYDRFTEAVQFDRHFFELRTVPFSTPRLAASAGFL